ncbi:MAG: DegQ family serine endoprotease [Betaproteobacteria bacterium]|nr:DegQ family serine endoprotease [Betaproteobacteria bacterium]
MFRNGTTKRAFLSLVLPAFLFAACTAPNKAESKQTPASTFVAPAAPNQPPLVALPNFSSIVQKEGPAVVNISTTQTVHAPNAGIPGLSPEDPFYQFFRQFMPPQGPQVYKTQTLGSGFIISPDGYIMTNAHVVGTSTTVTVRLTNKRQYKAKVIGTDKRTDVALIKIDAKNLPTVTIGNSKTLGVGQWVVAIGAPFGFLNSVTQGIVSAIGRSLPNESYVPFIQTDVPINPGNSGGPLFNLQGQVVGINSQIYTGTGGYMGLSFAIPINLAMHVADQLRVYGKVSRGRLGVEIQDVTPELASSFGLPNTNGALVAQVESNGPAGHAGIRPGDVILRYDGKAVKSSSQLPLLVGNTKPGTRVDVEVWRNGRARNLTVTVGQLGAHAVAQKAPTAPASSALGLTLSVPTPAQREELGVNYGLVVQGVGGAAAEAGIEPGDVVLAVNDKKVRTVAEFNRLVARSTAKHSVALLMRRGNESIYVAISTGK